MGISVLQYTKSRRSSYTYPPSPRLSTCSNRSSASISSLSEFEFPIGYSGTTDDHQRFLVADITPAEDLFYRGKILPLQPTPRLSMVKSLFFGSPSAANSRHSTGSCSSSDAAIFREYECGSPARPSFVADSEVEGYIVSDQMDLDITATAAGQSGQSGQSESQVLQSDSVQRTAKKSKSFSFAKISSVFKKEPRSVGTGSGQLNRKSALSSSRDVMRKYMKKVKPLYEKMSGRQTRVSSEVRDSGEAVDLSSGLFSDTFSGNLMEDKNGQGVVMSCPASMRSSPCHSGVLMASRDSSSEELVSGIQGAIAHCKRSMV